MSHVVFRVSSLTICALGCGRASVAAGPNKNPSRPKTSGTTQG